MERIRGRPIVKTFRRVRKPSIKITVSADLPPDTYTSSPTPSPQTVIKRIMTYARGGEDDETRTRTRITVDDSVVDFPNCIDFGIKDFLCCKDEIDLELSSDTDNSFLEATPPHRFSDSELESQIEIMSITLDNALNLDPRRTSFSSETPTSKDDHFTFDLLRYERTSTGREENERTTRLPPPPRPFRRHISLPASIFMTYLMAEQHSLSLKNKEKRISLNNNMDRSVNHPSEFLRKNERKLSYRKQLGKIDGSYSSNESTEGEETSNDCGNPIGNGSVDVDVDADVDVDGSSVTSGDSRDTPGLSLSRSSDLGAMILASDTDDQEEGEEQPFTSDIERKSLVLRYMRKLIRQDTTGNFAPPDYCI